MGARQDVQQGMSNRGCPTGDVQFRPHTADFRRQRWAAHPGAQLLIAGSFYLSIDARFGRADSGGKSPGSAGGPRFPFAILELPVNFREIKNHGMKLGIWEDTCL
jgi:hypothetical protein